MFPLNTCTITLWAKMVKNANFTTIPLTIQVLFVSENSVSGDMTTSSMLGTGYTALCNLRLSNFTLAAMACW